MIQVRTATQNDLKTIVSLSMQARLYHNAFLGNYFNSLNTDFEYNFLLEAIENPQKLLIVAEEDNIIKGFIFATFSKKPWLFEPHVCTIENICVDEICRRQGIGRQMLRKITEICQNKGTQQISLGVFCANKNAIPFYTACGFEPLSIKMNMRLNKEDL